MSYWLVKVNGQTYSQLMRWNFPHVYMLRNAFERAGCKIRAGGEG